MNLLFPYFVSAIKDNANKNFHELLTSATEKIKISFDVISSKVVYCVIKVTAMEV